MSAFTIEASLHVAGMFVFLAVHVEEHPDYEALLAKGEDATKLLMDNLWRQLAENLVG